MRGFTPGLCYSTSEMVAVARGTVFDTVDLGRLTTRLGGLMTMIGHPNDIEGFYNPYISYYAHLSKVYVKKGQKIERGEPVGKVLKYDSAKLMLTEGMMDFAWVDPEKFGYNHSYMTYPEGSLEIDKENEKNPKLTRERLGRQIDLMLELDSYRISRPELDLSDLKHRRSQNSTYGWAVCETYKFLEILYEMRPDQFPTLDSQEFESIKKDFYDNQPVILTLPLSKS